MRWQVGRPLRDGRSASASEPAWWLGAAAPVWGWLARRADDLTISREHLPRLLSAVPAPYRALVALAAGTGLRWGECAGLQWDALDLALGVVRVIRVAEEVSGHVTIKPYPKSKAGRRLVPVPPFAVQSLIEHERDYRTNDQLLVFTTGT